MTCSLGLGVVSYKFLTLHFIVICGLPLYQGYDMSTFVRRYGKYLNEKASSYTEMGYDFCRLKRG